MKIDVILFITQFKKKTNILNFNFEKENRILFSIKTSQTMILNNCFEQIILLFKNIILYILINNTNTCFNMITINYYGELSTTAISNII